MAFPRRPSAILRYLTPALLFTLLFYVLSGRHDASTRNPLPFSTPRKPKYGPGEHPIDGLIKDAEKEFERKIASSTQTLADTAAAYRKRRGRHPPPGFDKWFEYARETNAVIVEDFWDQIYHDLEPLWALKPARIRKEAQEFEMRIVIRDGKASTESDWFWTEIWVQMIGTIAHLLPDMDLALNPMDEPRLVVPWEDMQKIMRQAAKTKTMANPKHVVSEFKTLPAPGEGPEMAEEMPEKEWEDEKHYWLIARRGCAPDSAARKAPIITDFSSTPTIANPFTLAHMEAGYVANSTLSTDFCHQPDLQALEGIFVEPISTSATSTLFPLFGGSKLSVNNEILLPAPMYWREDDRFMGTEGASVPWHTKSNTVIWRGVATGGRNRDTNWRAFQRHRFIAMNNATKLTRAESGIEAPENFVLPPQEYALTSQQKRPTTLGKWVSTWSDVAFTDLMCAHDGFFPGCNYTGPYFSTVDGIPLAEQFQRKVLPDVDGNSFSGRYLGFLRSTSLPVKATLWREWHDSRLVAWKHFVPMDNRFGDWYGIVEYFLGGADGKGGRDAAAERIALAGREWAGRVLRKEDMLVYVVRLLLEYARLTDERREVMGWVGDLEGAL